jgi:hypothetical protein
MKKAIFSLILLLILGSHGVTSSYSAVGKEHRLTLVMPSTVLARVIQDVLPIQMAVNDLSGSVWVRSMEGLDMGQNRLSFLASISGKDLTYTVNVGSRPVSLALGDLDARCSFEASLRFDKLKNTLFIRPVIIQKPEGDDPKQLNPYLIPVLALINDREYPIEVQKLEPLIADFANKSIQVNMDIADIYIADSRVFIEIEPRVKSKSN